MTVDTEKVIEWFENKKGKVTYSMVNRDGAYSYDCSSSVYYALVYGGAIKGTWAYNTEYLHDWLVKNDYELIAENAYWDSKRGDIFIWGKRGASSGSGGHTGVFVDENNIIHCNYSNNGITIDNHDKVWALSGKMYFYAYRKKKSTQHSIQNGWKKTEEGYIYFKDGIQLKNQWVQGTEWYYLKENGIMAKDEWLKYQDYWYYLKSSGAMATNEVIKLNGVFYMFNTDGTLDTEIKNYKK